MDTMQLTAGIVLLTVASTTLWALKASPRGIIEVGAFMWSRPWGKQILLDFYGLEVVLALFMVTHAMASGAWIALIVCLVLMPFLGASAAAAYWLIAVV